MFTLPTSARYLAISFQLKLQFNFLISLFIWTYCSVMEIEQDQRKHLAQQARELMKTQ